MSKWVVSVFCVLLLFTGTIGCGARFFKPVTYSYFAAVANLSGSLSFYSVDRSSGYLSSLSSQSVSGAREVVFNPNIPVVYVLGSSQIVVFNFDISTGAMTLSQSYSISATEMVIHPNGKFLYLGSSPTHVLTVLGLDSSTGQISLNPIQQNAETGGITRISIDSTGTTFYCSNCTGNRIDVYSIQSTDGSLNKIQSVFLSGSPVPQELVFHPSKKLAFVGMQVTSETYTLAIDSAGMLTGFYVFGNGAVNLTVSRGGGFLLSNDGSPNPPGVYVQKIESTGKLTGSSSLSILGSPKGIKSHPDLDLIYLVTQNPDTVALLAIDTSTGVLTPLQNIATGGQPKWIAIQKYQKNL